MSFCLIFQILRAKVLIFLDKRTKRTKKYMFFYTYVWKNMYLCRQIDK